MRVPVIRAVRRVRSLIVVGQLFVICGLALGARSTRASDAAVDAVVIDAAPLDGHGTGGSPQGGAGGQGGHDGGPGGAGAQNDHDGGQGGAAGASHAVGGAGGAKTDGGVRVDASYTLLTDSGSACGCGVGFGAHHHDPAVAVAGALAIVLSRVRRRRRSSRPGR